MKKTKNYNIRNVVLAILSVLLLLVLIFFGSQNFRQKLSNSTNHVQTLNMAVVNEDNGTTYRGKKYFLAKDYLNGLRLPKDVSMDVVPRGVAESGLKNDNYQLVIYIPINFSSKIVDIDNPNPQKLAIQYKINARKQAMRMRCHDEANDIIQGLNRKLVTIYDLGIMSNLFDAQNKVAGIYARQGALAALYRNGLAEPITGLSQGFPNVQEGTKSLLSEGKAYQQAQKQVNHAQELADAAQSRNMEDNLTKIMQQQAQNNQNKAELAKQALQTSPKTDKQIPQKIGALANQNKQLNQGIGDTKTDAANKLKNDFENYSKGYEDEINTIRKTLQSTSNQLNPDDIKNTEINKHQSPNKGKHSSANNGSSNKLTFGEYLKQNYPSIYKELTNVDELNDLYQPLPFNKTIPDNIKARLTDDECKEIMKDITSIQHSNQQLKKAGLNPKFDGNPNEVTQFNNLCKGDNKNQPQDNVKKQTQQIVIDNLKNVDQDQFVITVPDKVVITNNDAQQINKNTYKVKVGQASKVVLNLTYNPLDLKGEDQTVTVKYAHAGSKSKKVIVNQVTQQGPQNDNPKNATDNQNQQDQNNQPQASQDNQNKGNQSSTNGDNKPAGEGDQNKNQKPDNATPDNKPDDQGKTTTTTQTQETSDDQDRSFTISFKLAVNNNEPSNSEKVQNMIIKWVTEYDDAAKAAADRAKLASDQSIQKLMNEDANQVLGDLVKQANKQNKQDNAKLLATLNTDSQKLAQEKSNYEKELASIGADSKQALQNAQNQIQKLQQEQDTLNKAAQKQKALDKAAETAEKSKNDNALNALEKLGKQAKDTNNDVSKDSGTFDGIFDTLKDLNKSLGSIQNSGKSLNGKSTNLEKAFRDELAKSGDFAKSFINVLNAAYQNGVPNQKLLNFITNPVGGFGNEVVSEKTQSYNMGMWTIVLVILSWFISYAVEVMKYFQKGKYFSKKQTRLDIHTRKLIFLTVTSFLSGIILAPIAAKQFPIIDSNRLLWNLSFIFLSMTLTFLFYVLMHNAKIWGTGLIIASLLNFIFNQTQFLKNIILQHVNVLSLVGNQLLSVAMFNTSNAILGLIIMAVIMVGCGLMILFIPDKNQEVLHEEAMV